MKILKKRAFALIIDSFIIALVFGVIDFILLLDGVAFRIFYLVYEVSFLFRDMFFGNASLGKRIMGIEIYDLDWQKPTPKQLVIRSFFTNTIGMVYVWKAKFIDGNMISVIDFEREKCKTRVIDKKVLKKLEAEAKMLEGDFNKNLSQLYDEYLRICYL